MKPPLLLASIATLVAIAGAAPAARADESHRDGAARLPAVDLPSEGAPQSTSGRTERHAARRAERHDRGMQPVPTSAGPGEPGHGWQYFSDSAAGNAVVISPQGDYFFSRGRGLHPIAGSRPGASRE